MSVLAQVPTLKNLLSSASEIHADSTDVTFKELLMRWTHIDLETPGAIVLPASEEDILKTVQWALKTSTPFVTKSGGHSQWSTIGGNGIIIDLSNYSGIEVDAAAQTATLKGSVLSKQLAVALFEHGLFASLGNGNTVGVIPYCLNGGVSVTSATIGFGSDQILSARVITASGALITVDSTSHSDLLYALRGAGQFFGLVTQLTIRVHPFSALGNDKGDIWLGNFIFPLERAREVAVAMKDVMSDGKFGTSGLMIATAPPPRMDKCIVVSARLMGHPDDPEEAYKQLYALKPLMVVGKATPIANVSDGREAAEAKGDFKKFGLVGLDSFDVDKWMDCVKAWEEMIKECPDAINTACSFQWDARPIKAPGFESAMSHHDIHYWQINIIWYTDISSRVRVDEYDAKTVAIMRAGQKEETWVDYQNGTRKGPLKYRFRGEERLARLKQLKKKWDPMGVFTTQLL